MVIIVKVPSIKLPVFFASTDFFTIVIFNL